MDILHLGAGRRKIRGAVTVDINPCLAPTLVWDLNRVPYPLPDNSFDAIVCHHVLEHLDNVVAVMEEIHRLGRPGARVFIRTPHFSSWQYYTDPTHRHPFAARSFDYFVEGTALHAYDYSSARFRKRRVALDTQPRDPVSNLLTWLINRNLAVYEEHFAFWLPRDELYFDLEVVKDEAEPL